MHLKEDIGTQKFNVMVSVSFTCAVVVMVTDTDPFLAVGVLQIGNCVVAPNVAQSDYFIRTKSELCVDDKIGEYSAKRFGDANLKYGQSQ